MVEKRRRTPAEIEQIVSGFESSGLNRSQFCRGQGLTLGVLNRYLQRRHAGDVHKVTFLPFEGLLSLSLPLPLHSFIHQIHQGIKVGTRARRFEQVEHHGVARFSEFWYCEEGLFAWRQLAIWSMYSP